MRAPASKLIWKIYKKKHSKQKAINDNMRSYLFLLIWIFQFENKVTNQLSYNQISALEILNIFSKILDAKNGIEFMANIDRNEPNRT